MPQTIPKALKIWFIIHFAADITVAIPLMIAPVTSLQLFGWGAVDPIATRLVAAALFAIGIESLIGRNGSIESMKGMLNLKLVWSFAACVGIGISQVFSYETAPWGGWMFLIIFFVFHILWIFWRWNLHKI